MVQVGGTSIGEVYELATHAEKHQADAVLVLPDLFFRPKSEEDLVEYLRDVASYCPTRPLLYYHLPEFTQVFCKFIQHISHFINLNFQIIAVSMTRFCELSERDIPNFAGMEYAYHNIDEATCLLKQGRSILLGCDVVICGALALGFETVVCTTINAYPEYIVEIFENLRNNKLPEARAAQNKLNARISEVKKGGADWVQIWKTKFNSIYTDLNVGATRKPQPNKH